MAMVSSTSTSPSSAESAPSKLAEVLDFPLRTLQDLLVASASGLATKDAADNLHRHMGTGAAIFSNYSGVGAWELGLLYVQQAAGIMGIAKGYNTFKLIEQWGIKPSSHTILLDVETPHRTRHLFQNINTKISAQAQKAIDAVEAKQSDSASDKVRAFEAMQSLFDDFHKAGALFNPSSTRPCLACGHKCPLWDISEAEASLPLLYFAGMTCKDVSQMNRQRLGILGASGRPLLTFLWELRYKRPAIVFTECTVLQDIEFLQWEVGFIYELFTVVLSPSDLGWWVDRRRRFCILMLRRGPYTMESAYWQNFGSVFHKCRPEVPERGDMFFAAPPEHIDEDWQSRTEQLAAAAGLTRPSTWSETLGASWQTRVVLAESIFLQRVHGIPRLSCRRYPPSSCRPSRSTWAIMAPSWT